MPAFSIAETPITNAQYAEFAKATGWTLPSGWNTGDPAGWFPRDRWDHPVTRVSFADAEACAAWYGGRLPLAREWERAARGTDGRAYPWGNDFDPARCQSAERGAGGTASVTAHPSGRSPDGALDTVGNVSEWIDAGIGQYKSVRGGSYQDMCRVHGFPWASPIRAMADSSHPNVGFRIVKSDPASNAFDLRSVLKPEFRPIKLARSMIGCPPDLLSELRSKYPLADSLVDGLRKHGFRPVTLKPFWIERHAVTNLQYWYFVFETGRAYPDHWLAKPLRWLIDRVGPPTSDAWLRDGVPFLDKYAKHPVINVSMLDAQAYCAWLSTKTKRRVRLPSTEEWQAAARGADGRAYPWGNGFDGTRCNYSGTMLGRTEDVAVFESGDSPTGCRQMVGNAFEWATTAEGRCLFHGGSYNSAAEVYGLTFLAMESTPDYKNDQLGFRIVIEG